MAVLYGLLFIIVLSVFYSLTLISNSNTDIPEGCSELLAECSSCHDLACGHSQQARKKEA